MKLLMISRFFVWGFLIVSYIAEAMAGDFWIGEKYIRSPRVVRDANQEEVDNSLILAIESSYPDMLMGAGNVASSIAQEEIGSPKSSLGYQSENDNVLPLDLEAITLLFPSE